MRADETDVNVVLSLAPRPFVTVIIATAIPAAMRPYSIAVAPFDRDLLQNSYHHAFSLAGDMHWHWRPADAQPCTAKGTILADPGG